MSGTAMVSAILLAAGESKRMGELKLLLPFGTSTIIEKSIDALLSSRVNEVIVVTGCKAEEVIKRIAGKPIRIVVNPHYLQGMSTSITAGLNLIDRKAKAIMIALADQPVIDSKVIDKLLEQFRRHDKGIAIPVYQGKRGHPVVFSVKYKKELLKLEGDVGGKEIIDQHQDDVLEVPVESRGISIDIDNLGDYEQLAQN
ncbi:MAG: molybdenum cofactor cytidylyltransferase [Chloroflexota bacterium]|nr:molybdenum cofactor cytidylyltransferase [Chloroflexota bacterium]